MNQVLPEEGRPLPVAHASLAFGVPGAKPGTLFALSVAGGVAMGPRQERTVFFGRNRPDVHVCVGEDDRKVSRQHGALTHRDGHWWISNTGKLPIRLPGSRLLFADEEPVPLAEGYTPLFVRGSHEREHLLELFVIGPGGQRPMPRHADVTEPPRTWRLQEEERLALVVLGQRYLLHESRPQPLPWRQAAAQLHELRPDAGWTAKRVEHVVGVVRNRLSRAGVPGLTRDEVGEPVGNALNDNLIRELLQSTTLVPPDLEVLDDESGFGGFPGSALGPAETG